ncbi:MAG: hypothetical protein EA359_14645 [Balneolaceae bacterium]|jgi:hypothetical protein|nr:MAG: hypothetical protein EA359_14645 [Balneolaceae bacterium]
MGINEQKFRNRLRPDSGDKLDDYLSKSLNKKVDQRSPQTENESKTGRKIILVAAIVLAVFFLQNAIGNFSLNPPPISTVFSNVITPGPSEDLLNRMNATMIEMGYTGLTHDDLRELRSEGVTATYISNIRSLGFTDLSLDQAVRLANANVSSAFVAMMMELGYELTIDEYIELRRAGITAHFTSNVHDLGYTDVTIDQLVRMRRIGVTPALIERLQDERGPDVTMEEIIRYRISNQ